jgi:acetolactate synthase-1/2/3 large subunit
MPLVQSESGPVICEVFMDPEQFFHPKVGVAVQKDGSLVSPPLEDMSPILPREDLKKSLLIPIHDKSKAIQDPS